MIEVGQRVKFNPIFDQSVSMCRDLLSTTATGVVTLVNKPHKWFLVEYAVNGNKLRTAFKFCDIGERVTVIK